jgi:hypothetical protein
LGLLRSSEFYGQILIEYDALVWTGLVGLDWIGLNENDWMGEWEGFMQIIIAEHAIGVCGVH